MTRVSIDLGQPNPFHDYPAIPRRLRRRFDIEVSDDPHETDWIVSQTIRDQHIWEQPETIVLSSAFAGAKSETLFVDIGSHVGWFSCLAGAWGLPVIAIDGNLDHVCTVARNIDGFGQAVHQFIQEGWEPPKLSNWDDIILKLDIEGAEDVAIDALMSLFRRGIVTHCVMEVSPTFHDRYPDVLGWVMSEGYFCNTVPYKKQPPGRVGDVRAWLETDGATLDRLRHPDLERWVGQQHQFTAVLYRPGAPWG